MSGTAGIVITSCLMNDFMRQDFLFYQKYAKTCAEKVYDVPFKIVGAVTLIVVEPAVQYLQLKQYIRRQKE